MSIAETDAPRTGLQILTLPDKRLLKVCRADFTVHVGLIGEMFRLMMENHGLGLAAPQVGIDARLFVTCWGEVFINPQYVGVGKRRPIQEGCLSVPGRLGVRNRYTTVEINGRRYEGMQAVVIQHETDHLDGILIV